MPTQTDPTARTFRSALVGWCLEPECRVYVEPYTKGEDCPMMCERPAARVYDRFYRSLAKRRVLICELTDRDGNVCAMCFSTQQGAEEHDCYSAY